jgi:GNAT superfamily N-acetyltransferase
MVFFETAADYVTLESGAAPTQKTVEDFFLERPPHLDADATWHFGAFDGGVLCGVIGTLMGFPDPDDAYIGLLVLSPSVRGRGIGPRLLNEATATVRAQGAIRQLVAVLEANPKGRAFWSREGFVLERTFAPSAYNHTRHRMTRSI